MLYVLCISMLQNKKAFFSKLLITITGVWKKLFPAADFFQCRRRNWDINELISDFWFLCVWSSVESETRARGKRESWQRLTRMTEILQIYRCYERSGGPQGLILRLINISWLCPTDFCPPHYNTTAAANQSVRLMLGVRRAGLVNINISNCIIL